MDQIQKMSIMKRDIPVTIGLNDSSAHWRYWNRIVFRTALFLQVARSHLVCWFPRHVDTFILNSFGIFLRLCFPLSPRFLLTPLHIHGGMAGGCCGWLMLTMHGFVTVKSENISYGQDFKSMRCYHNFFMSSIHNVIIPSWQCADILAESIFFWFLSPRIYLI